MALVVVACGDDDDDDAGDDDTTEETTADGGTEGTASGDTEAGGTAAPGTGAVTPVAEDRSLEGESVEILGGYSGDEDELMRVTLQPLIDATGIDVEYIDSPAFDTEIVTRVEGGDLPDIALLPAARPAAGHRRTDRRHPGQRVPRHRRARGEPDPWLPRRRRRTTTAT